MGNGKVFDLIIVLLFIAGFLFIGVSITGNVIGNTSTDFCTSDSDCSSGKICCITAVNADLRMCYAPGECSMLQGMLFDSSVETPLKKNIGYVSFGVVAFLFVMFLILVNPAEEKKIRKARRR
jgi:hypothetical protein